MKRVLFLLLFLGSVEGLISCYSYSSCLDCLRDKRCIFYQTYNFEYKCGTRQSKYTQFRRIFRSASRCQAANITSLTPPPDSESFSSTEPSYNITSSIIHTPTQIGVQGNVQESKAINSSSFTPTTGFILLSTTQSSSKIIVPSTRTPIHEIVHKSEQESTSLHPPLFTPVLHVESFSSNQPSSRLLLSSPHTPYHDSVKKSGQELTPKHPPLLTPVLGTESFSTIQPSPEILFSSTPTPNHDSFQKKEQEFTLLSPPLLTPILRLESSSTTQPLPIIILSTTQPPFHDSVQKSVQKSTTLNPTSPTPLPNVGLLSTSKPLSRTNCSSTDTTTTNKCSSLPIPKIPADLNTTNDVEIPTSTSKYLLRNEDKDTKIRKITQNGLKRKIKQQACILAYLQRVYGQSLMGNNWYKFSLFNPMSRKYRACSKLLWKKIIQV